MKLLYLKNKQIDIVKWDRCINNAYNGNIFGFSWYLSIVCNSWDAIIYDNYKAVFPLPQTKYFGIPVINHPLLSGQLGLYSIEKIDARLINLFLERIPYKFRKINLKLNKYMNIENCDFSIKDHNVFLIDLIRNSTSIYSNYSNKLRYIIDKTLGSKQTIINGLKPQEAVQFISDDDTLVNKTLKYDQAPQLKRLLAFVMHNNIGNIYGVYSGQNNLCALGIFLFSHNKISIPLLAVNTEGIKNNSMELLIHSVIFNNGEKNVTLSYEETNEKYFSEIFVNFGAEQKKYKEISKIRVIWPLNKLFLS